MIPCCGATTLDDPQGPITYNSNGDTMYLTSAGTGLTGEHGAIWQLHWDGSTWVETTLYTFAGGNDGPGGGTSFSGVVVDPSGNLYGTANEGGGSSNCGGGCGYIFKLTSGGTFSHLHDFVGTDGAHPQSQLTLVGVNNVNGVVVLTLYGTTWDGGSNGDGTVFKYNVTTGTFTSLYNFAGGSDGANPSGGLLYESGSAIYGMTNHGGSHSDGTFYKLSGTTETVLYSFGSGSDGKFPVGGLTDDGSGTFYGATTLGGSSNKGTVVKFTPSGGSFTESVVYGFAGGSSDGDTPSAGVVYNGTTVYGSTQFGGTGSVDGHGAGVVYSIP